MFRLHHDLISTSVPLPPGTKIMIELDKSDDEFVLLKPASDPEKYQLKILNIALFVPIAQLSQSVFDEFTALLTKPRELQSGVVNIHYRRSEVRPLSIPSNCQEFHSDILFTGESPVRIVVVLVDTKAKNGSYTSNPFEFRRKWHFKKKKVDLNVLQENLSEKEILERKIKEIERESQKRLEEMQKKFDILQNQFLQQQSKGKGRGKKSQQSDSSSLNEGFANIHLRSSASSASSASSFERISVQDVNDDPDPDPTPEVLETVYIKKIELLLNGTPVDQVLGTFKTNPNDVI